jgi:hypothetical protein
VGAERKEAEVEGTGIDLGALARALTHDERERCAYRPPHWPPEAFVGYEYEPRLPVPGASRYAAAEAAEECAAHSGETTEAANTEAHGHVKRGRRAAHAPADVTESATMLYGVVVAAKAMRHAYT